MSQIGSGAFYGKSGFSHSSFVLAVFLLSIVSGCGGGSTGNPPPPATFGIGGTVSGLTGTGLVLQNNGGNNLTISANGAFEFSASVVSGSAYNVTIFTQPLSPVQSCTVANGSGTATANVANIQVVCVTAAQYTIGGTVSGLAGMDLSLVLWNNSVNYLSLAISANGAFAFSASVASGAAYNVTIFTQPSSPVQSCTVANGSGTATANVANIQVVCVTEPNAPGQWVWMGGSSTINQLGTYGAQGTPSTGNAPGARIWADSWMGAAGNFWLFGGYGASSTGIQGDLNDLWKYSGGEWTWVGGSNQTEQSGVYGTKGTPAPGNVPGARYQAASWIDPSGNFWLFGGLGMDSTGTRGNLNDLWRYSNGQWAWMSGSSVAAQPGTAGDYQGAGAYGTFGVPDPANVPGVRGWAASWTDAQGNLWLFGGSGVDSQGTIGDLNDLWKFSDGEWTWMSGSNLANAYGVYGVKGAPAVGNVPGARAGAMTWIDSQGDLWLFGGEGNDINGLVCQQDLDCFLNDLWKYSGGQWTWMGGSNTTGQPGVYGLRTVAAPMNVPGGRQNGVTWIDAQGNFWLFGGLGLDAAVNAYGYGGVYGFLNDVWEYSNGEWIWMGGSNNATLGISGVYGTLGVSATTNDPGGRYSAVSWLDKAGNLWIFGGSPDLENKLNDLWEYQP